MPTTLARAAGATGALALLLAAAGSAQAAGAAYGGGTTAREPIVLTANRSATKLTSAAIAVEANCGDGSITPLATRLRRLKPSSGIEGGLRDLVVTRNAKGGFASVAKGTFVAGADTGGLTTVKLSGRLSAGRASGKPSFRVVYFAVSGGEVQECHSPTLRWSATRPPGRVHGGRGPRRSPARPNVKSRRRTLRHA
jgi:hypothetical protein